MPVRRSPSLVRRPRLIDQLNQGLQRGHRLTLISAPAGFGKTTLIADWGVRIGEWMNPNSGFQTPHLCWLSLDEGDNDPNRFLTYVISALQMLDPDIGERALAMLLSGQPAPVETVLTALINEISAVPQDFILVLDDYHLLNNQAIDGALSFLLDHMPPNMHLVIATREDPNLPLPRLRARGQLAELRAADLRFTPSEAADFLNEGMGLDLSTEDVDALEKRTEGWITGLQLAAISMQGSEDAAGFIRSFTGSHRFVLDYLMEEVLDQQPANVQTFLLQTAVLDRMIGSLCDAVRFGETLIGQGNGQEILEMLERANMFIIPLDEERRWYRYHHLFADLLRRRLKQMEPEQIPALHSRASAWYEENGLLPDAIRQAAAAGDLERVAGLAEKTWKDMDSSLQSATWLSWMKTLPEEMVRARPVLTTQYALALIDNGEVEEAGSRLQDAERWLDRMENEDERPNEMTVVDEAQFRDLAALVAITRAIHAQYQGDVTSAVQHAERALELLPKEDLLRRAQAMVVLGTTYWTSGDLEAAGRAMKEWIESTQKTGNLEFAIASAYPLADILIEQGHLDEAVRTYGNALQLASEQGNQMQHIIAHHYLGMAMLYHEMGDQEAATQHLQESLELGEQSTLIDWPYRRCIALARLRESEGDLEAAHDLLDEAKRVYLSNPLPDSHPVEALQARAAIRQGRVAAAHDWAVQRGLSFDDGLNYLNEFEYITLARLLIAEKRGEEAVELLDRLLKATEEGGRKGSMIEILIVQALAYQAQGDISSALASLKRALETAEPEGYVRTFVDEGPPMAALLSSASTRGITYDYANNLLAAFSPVVAEQAAPPTLSHFPIANSQLIEPLSPRELEVLQHIAEGLTNQEIADRLYLSLNTVKVHTRNIYGKLNAHHRAQAVAKAREMDILPSD